ncbi:MAG TPA: ABC transporter ATP-binding protein [Bryobacteraceae bacterium]|nr:ABC transporter ATP-binding protein [Bryobacteraceae bacterium]
MPPRPSTVGLAHAAASLRDFDYRRCARLAGIQKSEWLTCTALACGAAAADAGLLALLVPLGRSVGSGGVPAFWRSPWMARFFPQPPDAITSFLWLAGLMFLLAVVRNVFTHAQHMAVGRLRTGAAERLAQRMFERCLSFGKAWFDRTSEGRTVTVLEYRNDVVGVFWSLLRITSNGLLLMGYLAVMLLISWQLTLIAVVLFPIANFASRSILSRTAAEARKARAAIGQIGKHVHEVLADLPLHQAAGQERQASAAFASAVGTLRASSLRVWQLQGFSARIQELTGLAALLCMLGLAIPTAPSRTVQPVLLLFFFFIARLSLPVLAIFPEAILDIAERLPRCKEFLAVFDDDDKFQVPSGQREFRELQTAIEFRNLTFHYPEGPDTLRNVTFEVPKGQMTALVGPSGAGKSTAVNLLMRFYDLPPGTIRIDGVDIREFSIASLRKAFALVSQDTLLVSGSLRANLLFGMDREVSAEELASAVSEARLAEVVAALPGGLDGSVGERGALLSVGQRQRVAIARAILRRANVLLLDEATSGLDALTEELVREAIANAVRHSTALVIAHRFATLQRAAKVVVLQEGKVVQQGGLAELLAEDGLFRQMSERQQFGD